MGKYALLIGVGEYGEGLQPLPAALNDVNALAQVLQDPLVGGFDGVSTLVNPSQAEMARGIELWFQGREPNDLILLFYSGHGLKDDSRNLYFAARNTEKHRNKLIRSTATAAAFINECIRRCRAKYQVIILDCCFSGAFGELVPKNDSELNLQEQLGGEGVVVLASSSAVDYSFEEKEADLSIYTRYLVEGMISGAADENGDGFITVAELHDYVKRKVEATFPVMSPGIFVLKNEGYKIRLARSPYSSPKLTEEAQNQSELKSTSSINNLIAQSLNNDAAKGRDLLGIAPEVNALAEVLGMRALNPPLAVGILGGWGSGKSFVMHLMHQRLKAIYQEAVSKEQAWGLKDIDTQNEASPYVGHIYQIYFNSWTYAKADLWSSLMQTIFYELNYQLTIEKHLRDTFAIHAAVSVLMAQLSADSENSPAITPAKIKTFIETLMNNRKEAEALLQILEPKFWQDCSDRYQKLMEEQKNASKQTQTQDPESLKPPDWETFRWDTLQEKIDRDIGVGATQRWQSLTCKTLCNIWAQAKTIELEKLYGGGEVWSVIDNNLATHERDRAIKAEESLGGLGFLIWQERIANARNQGVIWQELSNLRKLDQQELAAIEKSLRATETDLESQKKIAKLVARKKLEREKTNIFWQPILRQAYRLLGIDPAQIDNWKTSLNKLRHSPRAYIALSVLVALIILGAAPSWSERMNALHSAVQAYLAIIQIWLTESYTTYWPVSLPITGVLFQKLWGAAKQYLNEVKQAHAQLENQYRTWLQEAQENSDIAELSQNVEGLRLQAEQKRRQVGLIANQLSLLDFVNNRIQNDDYGQRLGLIHQISRDLDGLSQRFYKKPDVQGQLSSPDNWQHLRELFPRGPARVILYIDDLDRCPPDRVVDVLEAVQLLINTPLFVVVLAIDDRYIARALENAYKGVLKRKGSPSGIDYLEKIIQIPYRTRPINGDAISAYLESHIEIESDKPVSSAPTSQSPTQTSTLTDDITSDSETTQDTFEQLSQLNISSHTPKVAPPPPRVAKFTPAEVQSLKDFCQEVDLSPRTAKRLINIYKILKILWFRSGRDELPNAGNIKKAVLAMLVLSGRYPTFMREVMAEIACYYKERYEEGAEQTQPKALKDFFSEPLKHLERIEDPYFNRERKKFSHDVQRIIEPLKLTLKDIGEENFNLALSFCFVGDIGYDPEDYRTEDRDSN
jgi:predicted KAP-like P-loop ATPase